MARVKTLATLSEVKLRRWPAGRVSQLKLFLGHLQEAVGVSLAAQVEQSPKRTFSEFVPKIVPQDITTETAFNQIRINFETPKGIKNLLFYEYQLSTTSGFYNFEQFQSPETFYLWQGLSEGTTYYLRIRVVTKDGEVGPWSDTVEVATPYSQAYGLYDGTEREARISASNGNPWVPVYDRDYTAIGGKMYYAVDYEVQTLRTWSQNFAQSDAKGNVEWSDLEFRWMENVGSTGVDADYVQKGQQFNVTTYASNNSMGLSGFYACRFGVENYTSPLEIPGQWYNPRRGTFVQKFSEAAAGDVSIRLEARMQIPRCTANDFYPYDRNVTRTKIVYDVDATVKIKNFNIFETLVST